MRAGSGSLAIGELLGAASFIVSVVAGSMPLVKPFRVNPGSFIRDVGFFTLAVACILAILIDGEIHAWEAVAMVGLYFVYVSVVVGGTWWENRRDRLARHEALIRGEYSDAPVESDQNANEFEPYRDDANEAYPALPTPTSRGRAQSNPVAPSDRMLVPSATHTRARPSLDIPRTPSRASSVSRSSPLTTSRSTAHVHQLPSFSLLGALEFRTVVNSLHGASTAETLSMFDAPVSPYAAGRYTRRLSVNQGRLSPSGSVYRMPIATAPPALDTGRTEEQPDPWDAAFSVQLNERNALVPSPTGDRAKSPVPSINLFSPTSLNGTNAAAPRKLFTPDEAPAPARWRMVLSDLAHTLFPSLVDISARPWLWKIIAVCSAPAIFALTLTLPVVVSEPKAEDDVARPPITPVLEAQLIDYDESDAEEELLQARIEAEQHVHDVHFSKWLTATQCALSPVFCVSVLFAGHKHVAWYMFAAVLCGVSVATLTAVFGHDGSHPAGRLARCFVGFGVAMVWIMAIADEVVQVLQTFGHIFGLSDAIIGLTIFAIGNSLADFVANFTVAAFAPVMGVSACFGGPMLNMLLGIGLSGSYVISQTGESYKVNLSPTLLVSTIGLLCLLVSTLVIVPLSDFNLTRRWGLMLIAGYVVVMVVNVIVEVKKSS
ncbi:hypothetical protein FRC09_002195 [Ceratobasidium sp. 395]|nr:hypothetical protein FRC09_002195 [Ceratobasidium sp. 395]